LTLFIVACAALLLLSCLFYLRPGQRSGGADADLERANVEWYRLRAAELAGEGADGLQDDARLRLLEDEQQAAAARPVAASQSFPAWVLLPLVVVLSCGLYYLLGAAPDVLISRGLQSLDETSTPEQRQALMAAIEARSAQRPDNVDYAALLGQYYMGEQDYQQAARIYSGMVREFPGDAFVLAAAAQAQYLAAGRKLSDQARLRAEQALAIDPQQRTALSLLGMASFEEQQYRAAVGYWQRLLAMEQPGSDGARMISSVVEMARQRLVAAGESIDDLPAAGATDLVQAGDPTPGVTVRVALPEGASIAPTDTVFVLARNAASDSRMPIAVQRLPASQLPVTLRLDDRNSMAGQKLSATPSVLVAVQVSPDGTPGEATATWLGQAGPLEPSMDLAPRDIVLQPRDGVAAAAPVTPAASAPGVTVRVVLPEGATVAPSDTVFVLARNAASDSRMPIAVQRLQAGQLPATLRLDDSNSMAGQKLSATESVLVLVQVSPSGTPGEAAATWLGQAGPLPPSADLAPLEIMLQPKG
jgi:cytochrome c-type biogenesis protein CcmH